MKILKAQPAKDGKRTVVTVELEPGEEVCAFRAGAHYRLAEPMDEVLPAHVLSDACRVSWCPVGQEWVNVGDKS